MPHNKTSSEASPRVITLCGSSGCCPTVTIDNAAQTVVLRDDDGGHVTLTTEQWQAALRDAQI